MTVWPKPYTLNVMPLLGGVFDLFPDLDTISLNDIYKLGGKQAEHHTVENHLANRILYPNSIAQTKLEIDLDFLILSLAIKKHPEVFFNQNQNRIIITDTALRHFPPLTRLISTILQSITTGKTVDIWLKSQSNQQILGSCIPFTLIKELDTKGEFSILVQNETKFLVPNQLNLIPIKDMQVKIKFSSDQTIDAVGGSLGLFVDLRENKI